MTPQENQTQVFLLRKGCFNHKLQQGVVFIIMPHGHVNQRKTSYEFKYRPLSFFFV